jgi:predicted class III extradiol MEMO1 family dioxygenase
MVINQTIFIWSVIHPNLIFGFGLILVIISFSNLFLLKKKQTNIFFKFVFVTKKKQTKILLLKSIHPPLTSVWSHSNRRYSLRIEPHSFSSHSNRRYSLPIEPHSFSSIDSNRSNQVFFLSLFFTIS